MHADNRPIDRSKSVISRMIRSLLAVAGVAALAGQASAAIITTTSGVYDEQTTQLNAVDQTATTPTSGTVTLVPLATFQTTIAAAAAAGTGGVINFDDVGTAITSQTEIVAAYGPGNAFTQTLTGAGYQVDMSAAAAIGATPISGSTYLRSSVNTGIQSFTFSSPVLSVGATVLARNAARSITATVTYDDATTGSVGPVAIAAASGSGATSSPDTFFGFAAPAGKRITTLTFSGGANNFYVIDDIGFVVPEPGSIGLIATAGLGLLARRRRRFARA